MNNENQKEAHDTLKKFLKFQEDNHSKTFTHVASEGAYRASCNKVAVTYQKLVEAGEELGIVYPKRF